MTARVAALDALRGFALVGIILGNVTWFSGYAVSDPAQRLDLGTAAVDGPVAFVLHALVDGKFYGLFALIFGASFALMVDGAEARGQSAARVVTRRLVALFAIGLAHATLVWFGDIVSMYAVTAVPLYWLRRASVRRLAVVAVVCLVAPVVVSAALWVGAAVVGGAGEVTAGYGPAAAIPAFASGGYPEVLRANWAFLGERWTLALISGRPLRLLGMFALGMCAVRRARRPDARTVGALVVIACVGNVALASLADVAVRPPSGLGLVRDGVYAVAIPAGSLAYAAVAWPWLSSSARIPRALAAAGRLSLSHYLAQSVALVALFYGCALGWWGRVGVTGAVVIASAIVALQVACSRPWLRWFRAGPAEVVLRWFSPPARRPDSTRTPSCRCRCTAPPTR